MPYIEKVIFSPDYLEIILLGNSDYEILSFGFLIFSLFQDANKAAQIIHVEILYANVEKLNQPLSSTINSKTEPMVGQLKARKNLQVVKLHKVQVVDCAQIEIKVILFFFSFFLF